MESWGKATDAVVGGRGVHGYKVDPEPVGQGTYQIKSNDPNISPSYATVHLSHKIAPLSSSSLSFLLTLSLAYVFLAKMVQNFIKDSNEKQSAAKCVHNRCNCFNGNGNNGSEDELDGFGKSTGLGSFGDDCDALKVRRGGVGRFALFFFG
ncbi:hypothetical protein CRG98_020902 [Punica granatum]|uniref:Uncharacterized protein n=1 Tax=Punica granatum TaxID=22663 RepID=A0A2I0JTB8_PUNGR|nr:hypothetical protein CRG98_020902 [Punica granatum]